MKPPRTISAQVTLHETLKHAGGGRAASFPIKRPRAGLQPDPEPNPSTGDTPMPELTPQSTPPPDPLIPVHDAPPKDDPPASIPPIIEPKDFEEYPAFRETFLLFFTDVRANAAVRAFGKLFHELVLEFWGYWPDHPEGVFRA